MGDRHILSVDWDPRELRVVHARVRKGRVHVEDVVAASIPADVDLGNAEQLGQLLGRVLQQEGIHGRRVIVDIPRDQAVLSTLSLPNVLVPDMAGMVEVQIGKGLPFPVAEAVVDFAVPSATAEGGGVCDVSVAAVRREVLAFYTQVCQTAGLRLERIGLRPYANKVAVQAFLGESGLGGPGGPERVLMVDVGPVLTEIDVIRRGQLVFSRAASVYVPPERPGLVSFPGAQGAAGLTEPSESVVSEVLAFDADGPGRNPGPPDMAAVVADLMVEVTRSIEAHRGTDPGAQMDCAVVAGGTGIEESLAEAIQRRFGIHAETFNAAACLDNDRERGAAASGFSAALGLVLGHAAEGRLEFDFLHPKKQEVPGRVKLRKVPLAAAVAVLFLAAAVVAYQRGPGKQLARVHELEREIADIESRINDHKPFQRMVESARDFESEQVVWIDELRRLAELLPDNRNVVLENLTLNQRNQTLTFDIRTKDSRVGGEIVQALQDFKPEGSKGPYYEAVRGPTSFAGRDSYPHQGKITVKIEGKQEDPKKGGRRPR